MNYEEIYSSIDCKFPYHDETKWKQVIAESHRVGGDAPFLVLHEICRLPASIDMDSICHLAMYEYWKQSFSHPVQEIIEKSCLALIRKEYLQDREVFCTMEKLSSFPKSYNALQIALFSAEDTEDVVNDKYDAVIEEWNRI